MEAHKKLLLHTYSTFSIHHWPPLPNRSNHIPTGVLVPLLADKDWTCLLTQRTAKLRDHAGEICFPGGKKDAQDSSLEETAIREAQEELSLNNPLMIGSLSSVPLYTSDYRLHPFLALFPEMTTPIPNPNEVAHVLPISIQKILSLDFIDGKTFLWEEKEYISPIFIPSKIGIPIAQPIFGGTAHVLYETITLVAKALNKAIPPTKATFTEFPFSK